MASKGWALLLLMVSVFTIALAIGSLGLYPRKMVHISPQGSAVITASVPELLDPSASDDALFLGAPPLALSPVHRSPRLRGTLSRAQSRPGVYHSSGHMFNPDPQNEMARRVCDFDS